MTEIGSAETRPTEISAAEVGITEIDVAEVGSPKIDSVEIGTIEVGALIGILLPPAVPLVYAPFESVHLFLSCHIVMLPVVAVAICSL
jgi:hypothetical protein